MNILTHDERARLLETLQTADDEILLDAVRQHKDGMSHVRRSYDEMRTFVTGKAPAPMKLPPPTPGLPEAPARANVNPGRSSLQKIGTKNRDMLIKMLKEGLQPTHTKYGEYLKLLHNRGEIKFDGVEYYI